MRNWIKATVQVVGGAVLICVSAVLVGALCVAYPGVMLVLIPSLLVFGMLCGFIVAHKNHLDWKDNFKP